MRRAMKRSGLLALALVLAGCSWLGGGDGMFRDRAEDYRKARLEAPLEVPAGLVDHEIDDAYPIPEISQAGLPAGRFRTPRPDPLEGDPSAQGVKIQRLGERQWILVESSPGQVWPQLRAFLNQVGLDVARVDPGQGLMETDWFQPADSDLPRERYRFRIEQGVQRGTSELFVTQQRLGGDDWPAQSSNREREDVLVQELSQYMANHPAEGVVSMVAERAIDARGKVFVRREEGQLPWLDLQLPFVRAWGALGLALDKAGMEVDDRNRSEGRYWIHVLPEVEDRRCGWLRRLFGCGRVKVGEVEHYLLELRETGAEAVSLHVYGEEGAQPTAEEVERVLSRIRGYIS